ncbi:DUF2927 domain-containing protein [Silicimonas sp. MF1-12-2]|uniref:DUF2927 domain-containing protein n=1 Tax=Silicimonas sp. MF1-12-2 TaxID=3384793 RepID=UPI0039B3AE5A
MRTVLTLLGALALAACTTTETSRRAGPEISLPPMKTFSAVSVRPPSKSNVQIARDFLDLTFRLENGEKMPRFTRFEGPVTVRVAGNPPASLGPDLDRLISRLRREAGIPISRVGGDGPASITIVPVSRAQIQSVAPSAACFVRPNVSSWEEYRARRNDPTTYWTELTERKRMAVFLPVDVSPQEIRDCLHEEISQALGPVNDLYRLPESIFNDDNFHTVLTGFDMLILRAFYDPALQNGMREPEVAARLPTILNRLNPSGRRGGTSDATTEFAAWQNEIGTATMPRTSRNRRIAAAERAVSLARQFGPNDSRLAFSYYILGRLSLSNAPETALAAFLEAGRIYQSRPDTAIQEAHVAMQVAAFQLSAGRAEVAINLVDQSLDAVNEAEHAALLSLLLMVKAEALVLLDRDWDARRVQDEALAWARYGFGSEKEVRERAAEIRAISPRARTGERT